MRKITLVVLLGIVALGSAIYIAEQNTEIITYTNNVTTTPVVVEESPYDDEWLEEAKKLKKQHLQYRKWQAEQEEVQAELEALQERYDDLDSKILEHEKHNQAHWNDSDWLRKLVASYFPENPDLAVAIAMGESGLNHRAYNGEAHKGCNGSYGVMQIACLHVSDPEKLFDPVYNLEVARRIYDESGFLPWGAYTDKSYLAFIDWNNIIKTEAY